MADVRLSRAHMKALGRAPLRRMHGEFFSLTTSPLPDDRASRFTCVVSKKIAHRATERNRIKRLCRESVRTLVQRALPPRAFVFYAKRSVIGAAAARIREDAAQLAVKTQ